jgi:hypothetical protein
MLGRMAPRDEARRAEDPPLDPPPTRQPNPARARRTALLLALLGLLMLVSLVGIIGFLVRQLPPPPPASEPASPTAP